jgi:hypothetical protein
VTADLDAAACIGHPSDLWYADTKTDADRDARKLAIAICKACPVRQHCLDDALALEGGVAGKSRFGIWGGLTPGQRARLRPPARPTGRALQPCGTEAAYRRHLRAGERACEPCLAANREVTYRSIRALLAGRSIA